MQVCVSESALCILHIRFILRLIGVIKWDCGYQILKKGYYPFFRQDFQEAKHRTKIWLKKLEFQRNNF